MGEQKMVKFRRNDGTIVIHKEVIAEIFQKRGQGKILTKAMLMKEIEGGTKEPEKQEGK